MKRDFDQLMGEVKQLHEKLVSMTPVTRESLGDCDYPGVYLFGEKGKNLYVGRTRGLKKRLLQHSRSRPEGATFAFGLARKLTGNLKAVYNTGPKSRQGLMENARFVAAFNQQRARIAQMDIRYVRVDDDTTQALLGIYTSTVLGTLHNEFRTT